MDGISIPSKKQKIDPPYIAGQVWAIDCFDNVKTNLLIIDAGVARFFHFFSAGVDYWNKRVTTQVIRQNA